MALRPAFGAEINVAGYYTAIADQRGHFCELLAEGPPLRGQTRLVFSIRQRRDRMTVTYLSQHRAVAESDFIAVKLDFTEVFGFAAAQKHEFFNVSGVSYQSQDAKEQQAFYRELRQAANGAKHLIVISADYADFMPTFGLTKALASFEVCLAALEKERVNGTAR